jgi:hypothetical protein
MYGSSGWVLIDQDPSGTALPRLRYIYDRPWGLLGLFYRSHGNIQCSVIDRVDF